jgi:26S proteasome regulatory subunit N2
MDNASAGEAAGIAMGLVQMGTLNNMAMNDMIAAAHDTTHEKIIRGLAVGVSFIVYGREEQADDLIRQLTSDPVTYLSFMFFINHHAYLVKRTT